MKMFHCVAANFHHAGSHAPDRIWIFCASMTTDASLLCVNILATPGVQHLSGPQGFCSREHGFKATYHPCLCRPHEIPEHLLGKSCGVKVHARMTANAHCRALVVRR